MNLFLTVTVITNSSSFDLSDFALNSDSNAESDADSVVTSASTSTGRHLALNNCFYTSLSPFKR